MMTLRSLPVVLLAVVAGLGLGGCPGTGGVDVVPGSTGSSARIGSVASVNVLAPAGNLSIAGGTPVEVVWNAIATTQFSSVDVFFDPDTDPDNGNEIIAESNISLDTTSTLVDTTPLAAGTYNIGVRLLEVGEVTEADYAAGQITLNQAPTFRFTSPSTNTVLDRSVTVNPSFEVTWTVSDPDSTISTQILLDPDITPNGNEVLLRTSDSQTGGSFTFDLPTSQFDPGTYRFLAVVTDGTTQYNFYSPGSIRLRARLSGVIDLREVGQPSSDISGAVFEGFNPRDNAGSFLTSLTDLDGDGFSDFMILAQFGKPLYQTNIARSGVGEAYLVYGRQNRFSGSINLNSTGTLFRGEIYAGAPETADPIRPSRGITSVSLLSDWDRDGVREIAFGLPFTDSLPAGSLGLVGGTIASGLSGLDSPGYFRSGSVVIAAGSSLRPDLGFPGGQVLGLAEFGTLAHSPCVCQLEPCTDCIPPGQQGCNCPSGFVGPKAPAGCGSGASGLYQFRFGANAPFPGAFRLGARISSNELFDYFGESISAYAFDSLIMSAPNRDPGIATAELSSVGASIPGAGVVSVFFCDVINGAFLWDNENAPPANAALNYPGTPDPVAEEFLPAGGPFHYICDDFRFFQGQPASPGYFVAPGGDGDPCPRFSYGAAPSGPNTLRIYGGFENSALGNALAIEDFNGDGLQDFVVGSPTSNNGRGASFIVLGRPRLLVRSAELSIEELGRPINASDPTGTRVFDGIRVIGGVGDRLGQTQESAGDFNGDGLPDVVIGSPFTNNGAGSVAVFFGSREVINLTENEIPYDSLPERGLGVIFDGATPGDLAGARVRNCNDIDGDGLNDLLIAAPEASVQLDSNLDGQIDIDRTNCGVVYLVYGSPTLSGRLNLADVGTERLPGAVFIGRNSGDQLGASIGEQGDRAVGIAGVGDIDGDGNADLCLSAVRASPRQRVAAGEVYLIYGTGD